MQYLYFQINIITGVASYCTSTWKVLGKWSYYTCYKWFSGMNAMWAPSMMFFVHPSEVSLPSQNVTTSANQVKYNTTFIVEADYEELNVGFHTYFAPAPAGAIPDDDQQNFFSRDTPTYFSTSFLGPMWISSEQYLKLNDTSFV